MIPGIPIEPTKSSWNLVNDYFRVRMWTIWQIFTGSMRTTFIFKDTLHISKKNYCVLDIYSIYNNNYHWNFTFLIRLLKYSQVISSNMNHFKFRSIFILFTVMLFIVVISDLYECLKIGSKHYLIICYMSYSNESRFICESAPPGSPVCIVYLYFLFLWKAFIRSIQIICFKMFLFSIYCG